jgi:hypothetical protein
MADKAENDGILSAELASDAPSTPTVLVSSTSQMGSIPTLGPTLLLGPRTLLGALGAIKIDTTPRFLVGITGISRFGLVHRPYTPQPIPAGNRGGKLALVGLRA